MTHHTSWFGHLGTFEVFTAEYVGVLITVIRCRLITTCREREGENGVYVRYSFVF